MDLRLYNTLTRKIEKFSPIKKGAVGMYTCGPTVYSTPHLGNLRAYIVADTLRRTLLLNGFIVTQVMNITDVGHLTSDADEGKDKMDEATKDMLFFECQSCHSKVPSFFSIPPAIWKTTKFSDNNIQCIKCKFLNIELNHRDLFHFTKDNLSPLERVVEITKDITEIFKTALIELNVLEPTRWAPATKYIDDQKALIERLVQRGVTYETSQALYFDVTKFPHYGALSGQALEEKKHAAREDIVTDPEKKHPADFALWFKRVDKFKNHILHWPSPWGDGFPGWHIECSAMSMKNLGEQFDVHTGGIDHIAVHHTNEIAQSEAATGKSPFVRYWVHNEFLVDEGGKLSKSKAASLTIERLKQEHYSPLAFRYFCLNTHYRKPLIFSWEALKAAQNRLSTIWMLIDSEPFKNADPLKKEMGEFYDAINDDLNIPRSLAVFSNMLKSPAHWDEKIATIREFDKVLGLGLAPDDSSRNHFRPLLPREIDNKVMSLVNKREFARTGKDWITADKLREEIESLGLVVQDTVGGPRIFRKLN